MPRLELSQAYVDLEARVAEPRRIDESAERDDDALLLELGDAVLDDGARGADLSCELGERLPAVAIERREDLAVDEIKFHDMK